MGKAGASNDEDGIKPGTAQSKAPMVSRAHRKVINSREINNEFKHVQKNIHIAPVGSSGRKMTLRHMTQRNKI